jgi:hypothetical protein
MAIFLSFSHLAPFRQPAPFLPTRKSYKHRPTQRQDGEELFRLQQTLTRCQPSLYRTPPLLFLPFYQSYLHTFYKRSILGAKQSASRTSLFAARRRTEGEKKKEKTEGAKTGLRDEWLLIRRFASSEIYDPRLPHSAILKSITATLVCCIRRPTRLLHVNTTTTLAAAVSKAPVAKINSTTTPGIEVGVGQSHHTQKPNEIFAVLRAVDIIRNTL